MKNLFTTFFVLVFLVVFSHLADANGPCSDSQYRQFDFWIGNWQVTSANGTAAGKNTITSEYQDCMLIEKYSVQGAPVGQSINAYNRASGLWHQTWVDKNGNVLLLSGGIEDGNMVLSGSGKDADDKPIIHRIIWQPNNDGTVVQHWQFKHDSEVEWETVFKGTYSKIK